jgi:Na+/glutamate symporter
MSGPEVLVPIAFFGMVVAIVLGVPLVRARIRDMERRSAGALPTDAQTAERLARIEAAVESVAIEVERISEAQRFTTKMLAERGDGAKGARSNS